MLELDARFLFFHSDINRHCKFAIAESLASMGRNKKGYNWKARQVVKTEVVNEEKVCFRSSFDILHCLADICELRDFLLLLRLRWKLMWRQLHRAGSMMIVTFLSCLPASVRPRLSGRRKSPTEYFQKARGRNLRRLLTQKRRRRM